MPSKFFVITIFITECDQKTSHTHFGIFHKKDNDCSYVKIRESFINSKQLLQSVTKNIFKSVASTTKCDKMLLENVAGITKCDSYYNGKHDKFESITKEIFVKTFSCL